MIKNSLIIFDCFGVIIHDLLPAWFLRYFDEEKSHRLYLKYCPKGDLGEITIDDAIDDLINVEGLKNKTKQEILTEWCEVAKPNFPLINRLLDLRRDNKIVLLSNAWIDLVETIFTYHHISLSIFDKAYISYKYKLAKPNLDFYRLAINSYPDIKFEQIFMVDDRVNAIQGIEQLNIKPILFKNNQSISFFFEGEKRKNYIFDFDGTIFDSYTAIVDNLYQRIKLFNIEMSKDKIKDYMLKHTSKDLLDFLINTYDIDSEKFNQSSKTILQNFDLIALYPKVKETLSKLVGRGDHCFIFTHRGDSALILIKREGINKYFDEIITRKNGFQRKPNPEGIIYLINKYGLDKKDTYYVGDREIDIESAKNAGIKSIFFKSADVDINSSKSNYSVDNFIDILNIK